MQRGTSVGQQRSSATGTMATAAALPCNEESVLPECRHLANATDSQLSSLGAGAALVHSTLGLYTHVKLTACVYEEENSNYT